MTKVWHRPGQGGSITVLDMVDRALELARAGRAEAEADLIELLSIPSISALPEHRPDCRRAAAWLLARLRGIGFEGELIDVRPEGNPVLLAEWMGRPGAPVLTIYGHYDVQPADPLEEWLSPPFAPERRAGYLYARGANDNKGQHLASLRALACWLGVGTPPINVRFLIEGEEEVSGRSLPELLRSRSDQLATDYVLIADGSFAAPGLPNLLTGLRGLIYTEIEVEGAAVDLHSGIFGGAAPNPLNALAHIIAGLKAASGVIQIPGFLDPVRPPDPAELESWMRLPLDQARELADVGLQEAPGEPGYSALERRWARPTLDVHGVVGGFVGEGAKTVIPARAKAKVSLRLVPDQDPELALAQLRARVQELVPPATRARVVEISSAPPVLIDTGHAGIEAARNAFRKSFGAEPALTREGGSIPVTIDFLEALHPRMIVTGFGLPGDGLHSPNERMSLDQFHRATEMVIHLLAELAAV